MTSYEDIKLDVFLKASFLGAKMVNFASVAFCNSSSSPTLLAARRNSVKFKEFAVLTIFSSFKPKKSG